MPKHLVAYHNDPAEKAAILARLDAHRIADEIVHGQYWADGKGCAVGCTLHNPSGGHAEYETQFGIPQMLARLEDTIFEGLANGRAKEFPGQFMAAIMPGANLSLVGWKFLHWLLTDEAVSNYMRRAGLFGAEMHSPIMCIGNGIPAIETHDNDPLGCPSLERNIRKTHPNRLSLLTETEEIAVRPFLEHASPDNIPGLRR